MTLPEQNGGTRPSEGPQWCPDAADYAPSPYSNVLGFDPKRTWICRCGIETSYRCRRCWLPICDLNARECAWHHCEKKEPA